MGAWGAGLFDNDAAGDWADELVRTDRGEMISEALSNVVQGALGIDDCFQTLVAAEIVAALRGWPVRGLYEPLKDWLQQTEHQAVPDDQRLALDAIALIRERSELAEEFGQDKKLWNLQLQKLIDRLHLDPKPRPAPKPRRSLSAELQAAIERLDIQGSSIAITKGGSIKSLHLHEHDDATLNFCLPFLTSAKALSLNCWNAQLQNTDAALESLDRFTKLEVLDLSYTRITDATLARLAGLTRLRELRLSRAPITDAGVVHLSRLVNLQILDLSDQGRASSRLTDTGLHCLRDLSQLRELNLQGTGADDSTLAHLVSMSHLSILDLRNTQVTLANQARHCREFSESPSASFTADHPRFFRKKSH